MQSAEQKYSQEIIAHADSMKALEGLKKDLASARASLRDQRNVAETAEAKLTSSEKSWKQQKEALDTAVADMNTRYQLFFSHFCKADMFHIVARSSLSKMRNCINISNRSVPKRLGFGRLPKHLSIMLQTQKARPSQQATKTADCQSSVLL